MDADIHYSPADQNAERWYHEVLRQRGAENDDFVWQRFREGVRWRKVLDSFMETQSRPSVLDVGGGNGGIELAFATGDRNVMFSVETLWNQEARVIHRACGQPLRRVIADGIRFPFATASMDGVLCLETLEHVSAPSAVGAEIDRVLRDRGVILLTTPPRWRYVVRADPHFGIRGLVALSPRLQRWVAGRRGYTGPEHYVDRIYSSTKQIAALFPECTMEAVLSRSRAPERWFWDAIVLRRRMRAPNRELEGLSLQS